ncbi:unnamed protein product [Ilex paraguariensis]|uniref:Uncharacterized protein n=1 Tax=Ilex paraguariensis TaxID=185542 RepID=A0ABC8UKM4_9AQUA
MSTDSKHSTPQSSQTSLPGPISSPTMANDNHGWNHHRQMNTKATNPTLPELPKNAVDHVSIPINIPSDHPRDASPVHPAFRRSASSPSEVLPIQTININQPPNLNPIIRLIRDQELGKAVLGFVIPLTTGLLSAYAKNPDSLVPLLTMLPLCIGLTALWNGLLLRDTFPRFSSTVEQIGAGCVLFAFFGAIGSFLPPKVSWASWFEIKRQEVVGTALSHGFSLVQISHTELTHLTK